MMDAILDSFLDVICYWIGIGFGLLKLITIGRYKRNDRHNPFLIEMLVLAAIIGAIALAIRLLC